MVREMNYKVGDNIIFSIPPNESYDGNEYKLEIDALVIDQTL